MMPGAYALVIYAGDTYSWLVEIWQDQHRRYPANLLGASAKAEIRDAPGGRLRIGMDCQVQLPNKIIVTLSAMQSEALLIDAGVWDLQVTQIDKVTTIVRGAVSVVGDVTDSRIIDRLGASPLMLSAPTIEARLPAIRTRGLVR
jgi:hypothetical protein